MAMNGTENTELIHTGSCETVNYTINGHNKDNGSIKEHRSKKAISKPLCNWLRCFPNCRRVSRTLLVSLIFNTILIIVIIALALSPERRAEQLLPVHSTTPVDCCPDGWVGYRRKCYYFAKTEQNWISSRRNCSSFNASLAVVDSQDEMDFLLRYKTSADHWIGLERDLETEPWKWVNGTIFNKWFQIRGGGKCAYINDQGAFSSSCTREEPWICSKSVNR